MIALVAAVPFESEMLRRCLPEAQELPGGFALSVGEIAGRPVGLLTTGIGKANAAAASAVLLAHRPIEAVVNFGCAGAFPESGLETGDLALAEAEIFGDEGAMTPSGFLDMKALGLPLHTEGEAHYYNRLSCDGSLLERCRPLLGRFAEKVGRRLAEGPFVTVSCGSGAEQNARALAARTGAVCENMEGAAIVQVCRRFAVPALEIRGISNLTVDRDTSAWDLGGAARFAQEAVLELLANWPDGARS